MACALQMTSGYQLGSVSSAVAESARIPVIVVRPS
jgi:nucleotide-binding universal stress UspA family protein